MRLPARRDVQRLFWRSVRFGVRLAYDEAGEGPAERPSAYEDRRGMPVRDDDVRAMARAQARFLVAGPARDPAAVDPDVCRAAVAMLEHVFRRLWSGPPATEVPTDPPATGRLAEVRAPTLVLNGLADAPWIQEASGILAEGIPGAVRRDLPETGHVPPLERPAAVTGPLRDFLASAHAGKHAGGWNLRARRISRWSTGEGRTYRHAF